MGGENILSFTRFWSELCVGDLSQSHELSDSLEKLLNPVDVLVLGPILERHSVPRPGVCQYCPCQLQAHGGESGGLLAEIGCSVLKEAVGEVHILILGLWKEVC